MVISGGEERRQRLIDWAKAEYLKLTEARKETGQVYNHDVGSLAFFLDVLRGDGDSMTVRTTMEAGVTV